MKVFIGALVDPLSLCRALAATRRGDADFLNHRNSEILNQWSLEFD